MPSTVLGKVRLGVLLYALVSVLPLLTQVNSELSVGRRLVTSVAMVLLATDFVVTYARRRAPRLDPLLVGVLLIAAASGLRNVMAILGIVLGVMATQALYGSLRATGLRIAALVIAVPAAAAAAMATAGPGAAPVLREGDDVMLIVGLVPALLLAGALIPTLQVLLVRHEQAAARERLLARTGSSLLNRTEAGEVRAIAGEAATALSDLTPGTGVLILRREGDDAVVERAVGFPDTVSGAVLLRHSISQHVGTTPTRRTTSVEEQLNHLVAGPYHWRALMLAVADAEWYLLVGSRRILPDDVFTAFETLVTQWSLAEANCGVHTELTHHAHHDQLTGLPNRRLFMQRTATAVDTAAGSAHTVALLVVDLDDFKQINDGHGHAAGDQVLMELADRLRAVSDEHAIPARFGGDEFALLLDRRDGPADALQVAEQLRADLLQPLQLTKATVLVGASIGVAVATPGLTAGDLLRCADIAMYSAKARGKNRVELFTEEAHGEIAQHRVLEEHLVHAVGRGEIGVCYQPQIDLRTGRCVGVEALARWQHPTLGLLPAGDFITLAERNGHIVEIGTYVLRAACHQAMAWSEFAGGSELKIAVNISPRQVTDPAFIDTIRTTLEDNGLPARRLTLEITESELIDEPRAHRQLEMIAELGVQIAIDDFGTGYASLASLRSFPVHQLKIDRTFLSDGDVSRADEMFQLVVSMGRILELETVAEGIETEQQHMVIERAGVQLAQGYRFAPPMPADQFPDWLADHAQSRHGILGLAGCDPDPMA